MEFQELFKLSGSYIFMNSHEYPYFFFFQFKAKESEPLEIGIFMWPCASSCPVVYLFDWSFRISCSVCWYLSDRPPPYFIRRIFPPCPPSLERPWCSAADDALRDPRNFGSLASDWEIGCAYAVLLSHWSNPILSALWLVGSGSGGWSVGVGGVLRAGKLSPCLGRIGELIFAYIHTGNRPKCWH